MFFFFAIVFKEKGVWRKFWSIIGPVITPIICVVMIVLTCAYKHKGSLERINKLISNRLFVGKAGIDEYGITLWGQKLRLIGNGRTTDVSHVNYNFLDVSYINMLVVGGLVFLSVFMLMYIFIGYIHRKNSFLLCALFMVALNCAIAHHLIEISYNIFSLALFATIEGKEHEY